MSDDSGPLLDAWGLKRSFGVADAVRGMDLALASGELVALVGPPQCGKSTLLGLLSGHLDCDEGLILYKGEDITRLPPVERHAIGLVRVGSVADLFDSLTIADHVLAVARNSAPTTTELYAQWQVDSQFMRRGLRCLSAAGLDVPIATQVGSLSQVQKRQLAFGLVALEPFDLVLWDEPLGDIPPEGRQALVDLLKLQRSENKTVLLTASDPTLVEGIADRVLTMGLG
jgi:branched-chain amino acid transport system ATP-binding protein